MKTDKISSTDLHHYICQLFVACGVSVEQANSVAANMVWSEFVGRNNFGVVRIPVHIKRLESGVLNPTGKPAFKQLSASAGSLEAANCFGHFAGETAMHKACEMAGKTGIAMVSVKNSNFYGTGAYFVNLAAAKNMIGLAMSNSFPKVVAHGGLKAVLGTNPFAFGAPRQDGDSLMVDFATSSLAGSTVREHIAAGEQLPEGLAVLPDGSPITDPTKIGEGALLPFGGAKGYGVALMVEILSGVLSGSGFSNSVNSTYSNFTENSDSGHCFIAIDIETWMSMDEYYQRMEALMAILKASNSSGDVLFPGEIRWRNYRRNLKQGLSLPDAIRMELEEISSIYHVPVPWNTQSVLPA